MEKSEYLAARKQLHFDPSLSGVVGSLALLAATFGCGVGVYCLPGPAAFVASQVLFAIAAFQAFGIVHDCGHGSFARRKWVNTAIGHVASVFCITPFHSWTYIHHQHHAWAGNVDKDPAVVVLGRWRAQRRVPAHARFAWRTWIPLVAFMQQIVFATYPIRMIREGKLNAEKAWRSAFSVLFIVAALATVHFFLPRGVFRTFGLAWFFYLVLTEFINLPHHTDRPSFPGKLPVWRQHLIARSCNYPAVFARLLAFNFNLHAEHHVFPTLPWYRLPRARDLIREDLGSEYTESQGMAWVWKNRRKSLSEVALVETDPTGELLTSPG